MTKVVICKDVFGNEYEVNADDLEQRIGVYVVIISDNKILLTRQWDGYSLIGGGVENGETLEEAAVREVKEETGLSVELGGIIYHATTFFKRNAESTPRQSFQFYFVHTSISGKIHTTDITDSEKTYTNDVPEWVELEKVKDIDFRHSVDLDTILTAYKKVQL